MKIFIEASIDALKIVCSDAAVLEKIRHEFSVENKAKNLHATSNSLPAGCMQLHQQGCLMQVWLERLQK